MVKNVWAHKIACLYAAEVLDPKDPKKIEEVMKRDQKKFDTMMQNQPKYDTKTKEEGISLIQKKYDKLVDTLSLRELEKEKKRLDEIIAKIEGSSIKSHFEKLKASITDIIEEANTVFPELSKFFASYEHSEMNILKKVNVKMMTDKVNKILIDFKNKEHAKKYLEPYLKFEEALVPSRDVPDRFSLSELKDWRKTVKELASYIRYQINYYNEFFQSILAGFKEQTIAGLRDFINQIKVLLDNTDAKKAKKGLKLIESYKKKLLLEYKKAMTSVDSKIEEYSRTKFKPSQP